MDKLLIGIKGLVVSVRVAYAVCVLQMVGGVA